MTAIAAIFNRNGCPIAREDIERVTRALTLYGRDFQRSARFGEAALGCALGFFTPEDVGKPQPVIGGGGRFAMLFDGRIDNRAEIGTALGIEPRQLPSLSDPQLAMRSYEEWGEGAFLKWIADFALILWDETERRLLLARDPFGRQGLVYYETARRFVVSTMPAGLHALPDTPRVFDAQRIADSLSQLMTETRRTFFEGILSLPAGHVMTVTRSGSSLRRYYDVADHVRDIRFRRDEEYVEAARELFETSVRARLRRVGSIGAFMSGGLDSSTCAVVASRMLEAEGTRLPTFTWVPQDDWDGRTEAHVYGDETPYVRAIGERFPNIQLNLISAKGRTHYHRQDEYLRLSGLPMRNAIVMGWFHSILEEAQGQNLKVMLTGDMGNMTLSHTGFGVFYELWRSGRLVRLARELRRREPGAGGMARGLYSFVLSGMLSNGGWDWLQRLRRKPGLEQRWLRYSTIKRDFGEAMRIPQRAREAGFDYFGRPQHARREFWYWSIERVHCNFGQWLPANRAMHGIDMRDPFSDRRLIEWCLGVPEAQFYRDGSPRWLMKRLMRGVLPDIVLDKRLLVGRPNSDWQVRLQPEIPRMRAELAAMRDDPDLSRMVDIGRLEAWLDDWPIETVTEPNDDRRLNLGVYLSMTMQAARFVQLVKGTNN